MVYGTPPVRPEQDQEGRYYILDEDGSIVYTDENGEPLEDEPDLPADTGNSSASPNRPNGGTDVSQQPDQGEDTENGNTAPDNSGGNEPEPPDEEPPSEEPAQPQEPEEPEEPEDEGPPSWLFPDA